jgi:hypothetical protein
VTAPADPPPEDRCGVCKRYSARAGHVVCDRCADAYLADLDDVLAVADDDDVDSNTLLASLQAQCAIIRATQGELSDLPFTIDECGYELKAQHEWLVSNPEWAPALTMHMADIRRVTCPPENN